MRVSLHLKILIGAIVGAGAGGAAYLIFRDNAATPDVNEAEALQWIVTYIATPIGDIFLNLLFMLVLPLMFAALVLGISEYKDLRKLGRVGLKTLMYTIIVSMIAVFIGISVVNLLRPGEGIPEEVRTRLLEDADPDKTKATTSAASGMQLIVDIVPRNPIKAAAENNFLGWMFFAVMVGVGICLVQTQATAQFRLVMEGLFEICMRLIGLIIALAPLGVCALLFKMTASFGWDLLWQLAKYGGVVLLALALHQFVVYPLIIKFVARRSPLQFFRDIQEAMVTAFSTSSSNATLPTAIKVAEENLRVPSHISRFVLTVGATANQNGTALFEGITVLFLAQFYGIHLDLGQQFIVVLMCILGGIGTAGVPSGSLPVIAIICGMVGIPPEGIGMIFGIDRFLDMCRTVLNVSGDLTAAVVVSRGEEQTSEPHASLRV
jgi:DAACS family dicarboxylate/amino acid:cation (Na+ or H+) symporter